LSIITFNTTDIIKLINTYSVAKLSLKGEINRIRDFARVSLTYVINYVNYNLQALIFNFTILRKARK